VWYNHRGVLNDPYLAHPVRENRLTTPEWRRGLSTFDLLGILAVVGMIASVSWLISKSGSPSSENSILPTAEDIAAGFREGDEWHGIYRRDQKLGFISIHRTRVEGGYEIAYSTLMTIRMMGQEQRIEAHLLSRLNTQFEMTSFSGELSTALTEFAVGGEVTPQDDGTYLVTYRLATGDEVESGQITLPRAPQLQGDLRTIVLENNPLPGESFVTTFFDPLRQRETEIVLDYQGREMIAVMGQSVNAHHIVQHLEGQQLSVWVNDLGETLREELPLGLIGVRESRGQAMYGFRHGESPEAPDETDLLTEASIPLTGNPGDLTTRPRISWRLSGIVAEELDLEGGRQSVTNEEGSTVLAIVREPIDTAPTLDDTDFSTVTEFLEPSPLIQSDHRLIVDKAREIRGDERRISEIVRRTSAWVHGHMTQQMVAGIPSAIEILDHMTGDCNEHATLTTALLRAAGVPARIATGVAYMDGAFYFHAWVEYWQNGWRSVDPTWHQQPADVGHIRLATGGIDRQLILGPLFGRMSVELVE
ncbi:MAG: transglutaminase domain-containing protein, partial [Myxococcales bacterium]|nr:transglutaminase domain-containing protein [Myxococcales bacterium]